ncbi:DUF6255 family natural product biosynthesis protein [Streptomyces sp. NPDC037389]|uniref:DUF6255 family natural product biosynthesis protein n=1 Tax=Streptomyces sp. NPDC037389 TaxID=3155369 RepID=UPI0033F8D526
MSAAPLAAVGRCQHNPSGWTHAGGESRCHSCGVRRFSGYAALRPPGLAAAITPAPRDPHAADRAAALGVARAVRARRAWSRWLYSAG